VIFQDPFESLNSRFSVRDIIAEPFEIQTNLNAREIDTEVKKLLELTGLPKSAAEKFPHEFSGGQRQRIGIARAIALNPGLIICDEPVSALDVSIQSQIINLLMDLQERLKLTYLFIAHDLAVVKHISDRIAVMYLGQIVEIANAVDLYKNAAHPYTQALISAIPSPDFKKNGKRIILKGDVPSPASPPKGCRFHTRCPIAEAICKREQPRFRQVGSGTDSLTDHFAACHLIGR
jgi:oligopeptide/dipeptide ABC transporter ATP-binding protein